MNSTPVATPVLLVSARGEATPLSSATPFQPATPITSKATNGVAAESEAASAAAPSSPAPAASSTSAVAAAASSSDALLHARLTRYFEWCDHYRCATSGLS